MFDYWKQESDNYSLNQDSETFVCKNKCFYSMRINAISTA